MFYNTVYPATRSLSISFVTQYMSSKAAMNSALFCHLKLTDHMCPKASVPTNADNQGQKNRTGSILSIFAGWRLAACFGRAPPCSPELVQAGCPDSPRCHQRPPLPSFPQCALAEMHRESYRKPYIALHSNLRVHHP